MDNEISSIYVWGIEDYSMILDTCWRVLPKQFTNIYCFFQDTWNVEKILSKKLPSGLISSKIDENWDDSSEIHDKGTIFYKDTRPMGDIQGIYLTLQIRFIQDI